MFKLQAFAEKQHFTITGKWRNSVDPVQLKLGVLRTHTYTIHFTDTGATAAARIHWLLTGPHEQTQQMRQQAKPLTVLTSKGIKLVLADMDKHQQHTVTTHVNHAQLILQQRLAEHFQSCCTAARYVSGRWSVIMSGSNSILEKHSFCTSSSMGCGCHPFFACASTPSAFSSSTNPIL